MPQNFHLSLNLRAIGDPNGDQTIFSRALLDADFGPLGRNQHPARLRERTLNEIFGLEKPWLGLKSCITRCFPTGSSSTPISGRSSLVLPEDYDNAEDTDQREFPKENHITLPAGVVRILSHIVSYS